MKKMLRIIAVLLCGALGFVTDAEAYDLSSTSNGTVLYYNYINDGKELEVTYGPDNYNGDITIPAEVAVSNDKSDLLPVTSIGVDAFYECSEVTAVTLPETIKRIERDAFSGCSIKSIRIPAAVNWIGEGAFRWCVLDKVIIPDILAWCKVDFESQEANPMPHAQAIYNDESEKITKLVIPDEISIIKPYAFMSCLSLEEIEFPEGLTKIQDWAFYECTNLKHLEIPANVTSLGKFAFRGCEKLESITLPNGKLTGIAEGAFGYCTSLTTIKIPACLPALGFGVFEYCTALKSVEFSNGLSRIADDAFSSCTSLEMVNLPEGMTYLGWGAFENCTALKTVVIPSTMEIFDMEAFKGDKCIETIVSLRTDPVAFGQDVFSGQTYRSATLYVPVGCSQKYAEVEGWNYFLNLKEGVPVGVKNVTSGVESFETARYNIHGAKITTPEKGINIIKLNDGTYKKVLVK